MNAYERGMSMQTIQRNLRTCRDEIKGIAILWVVFFHARLGLSGLLYDVQKIGYGGVDLFFFLSGFGLYHSLKRNSDLGGYFKRRAKRLLPSYLPFCAVWLVVMLWLTKPGAASAVRTVMGNLFMVGFFSGAPLEINWYVSALALSLAVAPLFYAFLSPDVPKRAVWLIAGCFLAGLAFVDQDSYIVISRLPVFAAGMAFAGWENEKPNGKTLAAILAAAGVLGLGVLMICFSRFPDMLLTYAMYWHPFFLIAPAMCAGLGWLFGKCPRKLLSPLSMLGAASFEIFLFNAWIEFLGKKHGLCSSASEWILWSIVSIIAGVLYHLAVARAWSEISKKTQKRG